MSHWKRTLAAGIILAALIAGIAVAWTYMVKLAIRGEERNLEQALVALDQRNYEQARSLVRQVLNSGAAPRHKYGVALFVLGAVKTYDAGSNALPERRRTEYLVASRYLSEARSYGFPRGREKLGLMLLGQSLVEACYTNEGIEVLAEGLEVEPASGGPVNVAIHRSLAEAYRLLPVPDYSLALSHVAAVLDDEGLSSEERVAALILKAQILGNLNQYDESLRTLALVSDDAQGQPAVLVARGQLLLDGVERALDRLPLQSQRQLPTELAAQVNEAVALLNQAQSIDAYATDITRRSLFLIGRAAELQGQKQEALRQFTSIRQRFGDTLEGLAATLAEADIRRRAEDEAALTWYRQVLESEIDPTTYRSDILPLERLRARILNAVGDFVERGKFADSLRLLDRFPPLFTRTQQLELRGETLRRWGDRLLQQAADGGERSQELRRAGLRRLREAGVAIERLATLRFATHYYTGDLWEAADCFYRGQSYSSAARLLNLYLQHEPEKRNAQALSRLGQANLALGRVEESIAAFEECIELYERDNATYQARIDCARAYWYLGNAAEAERLLRINLAQSTLKPESPEWKDSLFAYGLLLFEQGRHEEAIITLEEAVLRYPNDRQTLQARYLVGEAYRRWAAEPLELAQESRSTNEREKSQQLVRERLTLALENVKQVQSDITLKIHNAQDDPIYAAMRRNCYMLEGAVLFDLGRYNDAIEAYQNVSALYPNEPFVLETFVQIARCWQRLDRIEHARGAIEQAQLTLEHLPNDAEFTATTAFNRDEWRLLLSTMKQW